ncbi:MAG TPA: carbonic anhydrase, partial [Opitutales bacterium]|nr:carbonic anhydrase [Opitutales bacterium]
IAIVVALKMPIPGLAAEESAVSIGANTTQIVKDFLKSTFADNDEYVENLSKESFKTFAEAQSPRATVVCCSDSRFQSDSFHKNPVNDLFFIRNIGNQIVTTEGSVEYGINHLNTPLLLIIGHSQCGAISTALGNYSKESKAIRTELNHLELTSGIPTHQGVVENANNQVAYALRKFNDRIQDKSLVVVGAVYDFRDDFNQGHGRLILVNLNGETNKDKIKQSEYVKDLAVRIGLE